MQFIVFSGLHGGPSTVWMVDMTRKIVQIEKKRKFKQLQFHSWAAILKCNTRDGEREPSATLTSEKNIEIVKSKSVRVEKSTWANEQGRDRLEVRTLRCGRNNPGSNPGHGIIMWIDSFWVHKFSQLLQTLFFILELIENWLVTNCHCCALRYWNCKNNFLLLLSPVT